MWSTMRACEVMTTQVLTVGPGTSTKAAMTLLDRHDIAALPVLDADGRLVGIVAEGDLLRDRLPHDPRAQLGRPADVVQLPARTVGEVMTSTVVAVPDFTDLADVAATMLDVNVRSIPVLDGDRVVGMISRRDLLHTLTRDDAGICQVVRQRLDDTLGKECAVEVLVADGIVTLTDLGLGPGDRQTALVQASTVPGVVRADFC